jgi:hypothetical protein
MIKVLSIFVFEIGTEIEPLSFRVVFHLVLEKLFQGGVLSMFIKEIRVVNFLEFLTLVR